MTMDPMYRTIHERVDCDLIRLQGLLCAMESVIEMHPHLTGPDLETQALNSILYAMMEKVELGLEAQALAWVQMGAGDTAGRRAAFTD